jgi:Transcriptional regulation of mitochondrial recombination
MLILLKSPQIMPQLLNHGKKTVPAALRRDVWRPYFAVHFPETAAGARAGLAAYRRLREFTMRRQLDPPPDYLITTEEDYEKAKRAAGDPADVRERQIDGKLKLPMIGQRLPKKLRAKKLMDQRATSVADLSFVLALAQRELPGLEHKVKISPEERDRVKRAQLGRKGKKRLSAIRGEEEEAQKEIAELQVIAQSVDRKQGQMPLDRQVADQLSIEYDGIVAGSNRVINMADIERVKTERGEDESGNTSHEIEVLWADFRDGTYAQGWPEGVLHGELQPVAASKRAGMRIRQHETVDDDGVLIQKQKAAVSTVSGWSPHIIGRLKDYDYKPFQEVLRQNAERNRPSRVDEATRMEEFTERESFGPTRQRLTDAADKVEALVSDPEFYRLGQKEAAEEYMEPDERSRLAQFQKKRSALLKRLAPLRQLEVKYPELTIDADFREYWDLHSTLGGNERLKKILGRIAGQEHEQKKEEVAPDTALNEVLNEFVPQDTESKPVLLDAEERTRLQQEIGQTAAELAEMSAVIAAAQRAKQSPRPDTNIPEGPLPGSEAAPPAEIDIELTTKKLERLKAHQTTVTMRLAMGQPALADFLEDREIYEQHMKELLPKSYRDRIYWSGEGGSEFGVKAWQKEYTAPSTEEVARSSEVQREEGKGFVKRLGERVGGWLGRGR